MTEIRPFHGWRYKGDVSKLVAPPYDILSAADRDELLARSPDNIVAIDMPHFPPKDVGPDSEYQAAADKLHRMQADGVLVRESAPALYAYSQTYTWAGKTYCRRAMLCGVRATELCEGIWPHEKTFAGPKADRLKLTEFTQMQLSPIFGFYDDQAGVSDMLWNAAGPSPNVQGELNGVQEQMWAVTDPRIISQVCALLAGQPIFIADGHHRYTTALNYRNALKAAGKIDEDHPANFVLFALVPMNDPGLLVLPTHRLFTGLPDGFSASDLAGLTAKWCSWQRVEAAEKLFDDADAFLQPFGPHAMAFIDQADARDGAAHVAQLTDLSVMSDIAPDEVPVWRELDVAILHRFFMDQHLAPRANQLETGYTARGREVLQALRDGRCQLAAMLQGTPLPAVKDIALAHSVMPHKSTYFYPKLATGMVLKPLK